MSTTDSVTQSPALPFDIQDPREALVHPGITSEVLFDFDLPAPPHLREIYGAVYRAMSEAPKHAEAHDRLARLMPREHGKTEAGTIVIPTWAALRDPNTRILIMSINEDKAADKLSEAAEHIERLAPVFGREIIKNNETQLTLERTDTYEEPTIQAAGFKTGVTGGHYDLLIFDDIITYETQRTAHRRDEAWAKFQDFLNLDSKQGNSVFLVLGTRKHREDLYSELIQSIGWDTRVEQAIDDWSLIENGAYEMKTRHQETGEERWYAADETARIDPETETVSSVYVDRDVGVLWEEWASIEALIRDMIVGYGAEESTLIWQRENQNDPGALEGEILSESMLEFVDPEAIPDRGLRYYAGVDIGLEDDPERAARNDTDYWAFAAIAEDPSTGISYLVRLRRTRGIGQKDGVEWIGTQLQRLRARRQAEVNAVLVESNQAQRWLVEHGQDEGFRFAKTSSSGEKEQRIIDMSSLFERGQVLVLEDAMNDWEKFVSREWSAFPTGEHDDRLDAIEIALRNVGRGSIRSSKHSLGDLA